MLPTAVFVLGYLVAWTGYSVLATLAQWGLRPAALLSPMMASASPILGGLILLAADVFKWTPLTAFVLVEKVVPRGDLVGRVAGVILVVAGVATGIVE